jgi:hypothetical protein
MMDGMTDSAQVRHINAQCLAAEPAPNPDDQCTRYRHRVTNKSYVLVLELGGTCELEGIDRRCIHLTRDTLDNNAIWERLQ